MFRINGTINEVSFERNLSADGKKVSAHHNIFLRFDSAHLENGFVTGFTSEAAPDSGWKSSSKELSCATSVEGISLFNRYVDISRDILEITSEEVKQLEADCRKFETACSKTRGLSDSADPNFLFSYVLDATKMEALFKVETENPQKTSYFRNWDMFVEPSISDDVRKAGRELYRDTLKGFSRKAQLKGSKNNGVTKFKAMALGEKTLPGGETVSIIVSAPAGNIRQVDNPQKTVENTNSTKARD